MKKDGLVLPWPETWKLRQYRKEESAFVIADLTGGRGGVYYEAGYAMAKGKQIILSCKK